MHCPKCDQALIKVKVTTRHEYGGDILNDSEQTDEIELDQCTGCNGVWFDMDELDQYLSEKLLILNSSKVKEYKRYNEMDGACPKCNKPMVKERPKRFKGVLVDICKECKGIWLDSSELDRLEEKSLSLPEKHALVFKHFKELFLE